MTEPITTLQRWLAYPRQVSIAFDQFINALIPPFITLSYADETMSARIYRGDRRGRIIGRVLMPPTDRFFAIWQTSDPEIDQKYGDGRSITGHCERAYYKEIERRGLPPEYRP